MWSLQSKHQAIDDSRGLDFLMQIFLFMLLHSSKHFYQNFKFFITRRTHLPVDCGAFVIPKKLLFSEKL